MVIFVSLLYPEGEDDRVLKSSTVGIEGAANNFQWGLIKGVQEVTSNKVRIINSVPMGSFPRFNKIIYQRGNVFESPSFVTDNIGFVNLPIIKQWNRRIGLVKRLNRFLEESDEQHTLVIYSLYQPYLKAIKTLKKRHKNTKCVLIVTDLPGVNGLQTGNKFREWIKSRIGDNAIKLCKYIDSFVLLTEPMKEVLSVGNRPYIIIEGVYNSAEREDCIIEKKNSVIAYTGTIEDSLGINTLLDAFDLLENKEAILLIAGSGRGVDSVKERASVNTRIKYLGYLPRNEILKLQYSASVLVNPRHSNEVYTKYSFPSKTMEYLSTGVPVVMNKLEGIPEEYYPYLYFTESDSPEDLAKTIDYVLRLDTKEIEDRGQSAKQFIVNQKSSVAQGKKFVDFIGHVFGENECRK